VPYLGRELAKKQAVTSSSLQKIEDGARSGAQHVLLSMD
jgi:hypothetical protein